MYHFNIEEKTVFPPTLSIIMCLSIECKIGITPRMKKWHSYEIHQWIRKEKRSSGWKKTKWMYWNRHDQSLLNRMIISVSQPPLLDRNQLSLKSCQQIERLYRFILRSVWRVDCGWSTTVKIPAGEVENPCQICKSLIFEKELARFDEIGAKRLVLKRAFQVMSCNRILFRRLFFYWSSGYHSSLSSK